MFLYIKKIIICRSITLSSTIIRHLRTSANTGRKRLLPINATWMGGWTYYLVLNYWYVMKQAAHWGRHDILRQSSEWANRVRFRVFTKALSKCPEQSGMTATMRSLLYRVTIVQKYRSPYTNPCAFC